jgi:hypothetical protein
MEVRSPFGCDRHKCVRIGIEWQALADRDQFTKVGGGRETFNPLGESLGRPRGVEEQHDPSRLVPRQSIRPPSRSGFLGRRQIRSV